MLSSLPFRYGAMWPALAMVVLPSARDMHRHACRIGLPAAAQPAVQGFEDDMWLVACFHRSANSADDQRYLHAGLQAFAGHIAQKNQYAAVAIRNDLEEVSAYLLCRLVLCLEHVPWNRGNRFGNEQLLNLPRLVDLCFPLLPQVSETAGSVASAVL